MVHHTKICVFRKSASYQIMHFTKYFVCKFKNKIIVGNFLNKIIVGVSRQKRSLFQVQIFILLCIGLLKYWKMSPDLEKKRKKWRSDCKNYYFAVRFCRISLVPIHCIRFERARREHLGKCSDGRVELRLAGRKDGNAFGRHSVLSGRCDSIQVRFTVLAGSPYLSRSSYIPSPFFSIDRTHILNEVLCFTFFLFIYFFFY